MWHTLNILQKRLSVKTRSSSWRVNEQYYRLPTECTYLPGSISFGLAWYQQAMKVIKFWKFVLSLTKRQGTKEMEVGAELRNPAGQEWVATMAEQICWSGGQSDWFIPQHLKQEFLVSKQLEDMTRSASGKTLKNWCRCGPHPLWQWSNIRINGLPDLSWRIWF